MYPRRTTASNTFALMVVMLLMCFATLIRAEAAEKAPSAEPHAEAAAIMFGAEGGLWVINADGSGLKRITQDNAWYLGASWSPDRSKIAYVAYLRFEELTSLNLWLMNADGSGVTSLTHDPSRMVDQFAWSPDARKLVIVSQLVALDKDKQQINYLSRDIVLINADGSGAKALLQLTNPAISLESLIWSPDGRKIAFLSNRPLGDNDDQKPEPLRRNIWVMNADSSHAMPLTRFTGTRVRIWEEMAWSPDSRKVTYISDRALNGSDAGGGGYNIWASNADGSGSLPLTHFRKATCRTFSWSPDGTRLTFSANDALDGSDTGNSNINIWVTKADGSAPVPLTTATAIGSSNDYPEWSPDGSLIAFASCINPTSDNHISSPQCNPWVMKADGTGGRQLTEQHVGRLKWRP